MVKITILGSVRFSPYDILAKPDPLNPKYTVATHDAFQTEEEYENACDLFYPAIEASDIVIISAPPDGVGHHTKRDMQHAIDHDKTIIIIGGPGQVHRFDFKKGAI